MLHMLVVQRHDLHKALQRSHTNAGIFVLRRLADHLHDDVPLGLLVKVGATELQGVEQGDCRGRLDAKTGLLVAHGLDKGCQNAVCMGIQQLGILPLQIKSKRRTTASQM